MRIAVVSPFVDRRHGTERALAELMERLVFTYGCEIHLFAQRVEDLAVCPANSVQPADTSTIRWHRVPEIPGPQLLRFGVWFVLNRFCRLGKRFDLVLSPGINCTDAQLIIVHSMFHRLTELARSRPAEEADPGFLRRAHRWLYYLLLSALERRQYANRKIALAAVSRRTAALLARYFGRTDVVVVHNGVDTSAFCPSNRMARREQSRSVLGFRSHEFLLLMIGNDWTNKGIRTILDAMVLLSDLPLRLLVVGSDAVESYARLAAGLGLRDKCIWQPWGRDVLDCYASADAYVSPSREDAFPLPVLEAMACGLPVVTSVDAGTCEIIAEGKDGFVLQDPTDARSLSEILRQLYENPSRREAIGAAAAATARERTWDRNAAQVWQVISDRVKGPR